MLLPTLKIGGSEEFTRTLAKLMAGDQCTPVVCALFDGGPLQVDLERQGTNVEVLNLPRRPMSAFPWFVTDMTRMWRTLGDFFRRHRINAIQTNDLGSQNFLVLALARRMGIPVVTFIFHTERVLPGRRQRGLQNGFHRLGYRIARHWASDYVAVSPQTKRAVVRLLGLADRDVTVISNGVDVDRYQKVIDRSLLRRELGLRADAKLLITVATLIPAKGHRHLVDAVPLVVERHRDAYFLFVGEGELRPELEAQTSASGMCSRIHFLGSRRDVPDLLAASDLFVLPSLWEGLSIALLEAMAAGLPIVATAVSGTVQVLRDKENGILVPPGDSEALAAAIIDTLSLPREELQALGSTARTCVEDNFSSTRQAAEYLALFERLATRHQSEWPR